MVAMKKLNGKSKSMSKRITKVTVKKKPGTDVTTKVNVMKKPGANVATNVVSGHVADHGEGSTSRFGIDEDHEHFKKRFWSAGSDVVKMDGGGGDAAGEVEVRLQMMVKKAPATNLLKDWERLTQLTSPQFDALGLEPEYAPGPESCMGALLLNSPRKLAKQNLKRRDQIQRQLQSFEEEATKFVAARCDWDRRAYSDEMERVQECSKLVQIVRAWLLRCEQDKLEVVAHYIRREGCKQRVLKVFGEELDMDQSDEELAEQDHEKVESFSHGVLYICAKAPRGHAIWLELKREYLAVVEAL